MLTLANLYAHGAFLALSVIIGLTILLNGKLNYRVLKLTKRAYTFKWLAWLAELLFFPTVLNVVEFSACPFGSAKRAVVVVQCAAELPHGYSVMLAVAYGSIGLGLCYILWQAHHLHREKISNALNEEYIRKKEVEFVVGISEMWLTRHFYLFSSFRSEFFKMYHRSLFNGLFLAFCLIHALMPQSVAKLGLVLALLVAFELYIGFSRPYRDGFSTLLVFVLNSTMVVTVFVLVMRAGGMKSALFVDNYFYGLLALINGFGWFLALLVCLFAVAVKARWPLDRDGVQKAVNGQELAIIYIKQARKFRKRVVKAKKLGPAEAGELEQLQNQLQEQFNALREQQPLCMDALLEVIDQLRELHRNHVEHPELCGTEFREELSSLVHSRFRIYETRDLP